MKLTKRIPVKVGLLIPLLLAPVLTVSLDSWMVPVQAKDPKLTVDQLVQRHLDSIGTPDLLDQRKSFALTGTCKHEILVGGKANIDGKAQLVSKEDAFNFLIDFARADYNGEQFITDGEDAITAYSVPGTRFPLSEFLFAQKPILREGLFGGVLTTAWPLLNLDEKQPRLSLKGTRKIDGRELYRLEYGIRKRGGDARINLYFSPEDFSHVLTTYEVQIAAQLGATPEQSAGKRVSRYKLEERFSDFRDFSGLHLPSTWVVQVSTQETGRTSLWQWTTVFDQSAYNQEIPDSFFQVP